MKLKKDGYEVEGTPLEIKEFIISTEKRTPTGRLPHKMVKTPKITHNREWWSKDDAAFVKENWVFPGCKRGKKADKARKHNKKVAKQLKRKYYACMTKARKLSKR